MHDNTCPHCGREFQAKRVDAVYCSDGCRIAAHRERVAADKPKPRRGPLAPDVWRAVCAVSTKAGTLLRVLDDDRLPRNRERLTGEANTLRGVIDDLEHALALLDGRKTK